MPSPARATVKRAARVEQAAKHVVVAPIEYVPYNLTPEQVTELWDRYSRGETAAALGRRFGKTANSMSERIRQTGGIRPTIPTRAARHRSR